MSQTGLSAVNIVKKLLGQETLVKSKTNLDGGDIAEIVNSSKPSKHNIKNARKVDKLTEDLIKTCNKILLKKEKDCQCYGEDGYPIPDSEDCIKKGKKGCDAYNSCRRIMGRGLSGDEPKYLPDDWNDPLVEGTHNCYMYFLDDQKDTLKKKCMKICKEKGTSDKDCKTKKQEDCSNLKPQPGDYAYLQGNFKGNRRVYSCPAMVDKVLKDNYKKGTKKSNIIHWDNLTHHQQFLKKCPSNYYKGVLVVHPGNTYHFYRQDKSGRFSHKQGTLPVENKDAKKKPIYVPHLSHMDYSNGKSDGINYTDFCGYMCVPKNEHIKTQAN